MPSKKKKKWRNKNLFKLIAFKLSTDFELVSVDWVRNMLAAFLSEYSGILVSAFLCPHFLIQISWWLIISKNTFISKFCLYTTSPNYFGLVSIVLFHTMSCFHIVFNWSEYMKWNCLIFCYLYAKSQNIIEALLINLISHTYFNINPPSLAPLAGMNGSWVLLCATRSIVRGRFFALSTLSPSCALFSSTYLENLLNREMCVRACVCLSLTNACICFVLAQWTITK